MLAATRSQFTKRAHTCIATRNNQRITSVPFRQHANTNFSSRATAVNFPKYFPKYIDELACVALLGGGLGVWYVTSGTTESAPTAQTTPNIRNRLLPISSIVLNNLTEGMFGK